jgi:senataxin
LNDRESTRIMNLVSVSTSSAQPALDRLPPSLLYHILVAPQLFQRDDLVDLLAAHLPSPVIRNLPSTPTPGLVMLAVHRDERLRTFARSQLSICDTVNLDRWSGNLKSAVESLVTVLNTRDRHDASPTQVLSMDYTEDAKAFWAGFAGVLDVLGPQVIGATQAKTRARETDLVRLVSRHLGDSGPQFVEILRAWRVLLRKLNERVWDLEDKDFAQVALASVLDNPSFEEQVQVLQPHAQAPTIFAWIMPFLRSLAKSEAHFVPSLGSIAQALLGRLQQPRFEPHHRALAVHATLDAFTEIFTFDDSASPHAWPYVREATKTVLEVHADFLVHLAFGKPPQPAEGVPPDTFWPSSSSFAAGFIEKVATRDSSRLRDAVYTLAPLLKDAPSEPPPPTVYISQGLWSKTYAEIDSGRLRGTEFKAQTALLRALASSAHLEDLDYHVWASGSERVSQSLRPNTKAVNQAFETARKPFDSMLMTLSDADSHILRDFLRKPKVAESLIAFTLSPVEQLHKAALSVVRQAYDVESRSDCFAALLRDFPSQTVRGLLSFISTFYGSARILPEACGVAKRLVRCLTDVNDVLCDPTSGLLRQTDWLEQAKMRAFVPQLWSQMCKAIALIFSRTPNWAPYFDNDEMTDWMRDAIIFAEGLLEHMRTFEAAALGSISSASSGPLSSPSKTSTLGASMIDALNDPLEKLMAWLRLNDQDLLQSTTSLLTKMIDRFARSHVPIRESVVARLRKFADDKKRSSLKEDQIMALLVALSRHRDYKDEFKDIKSFSKASDGKEVRIQYANSLFCQLIIRPECRLSRGKSEASASGSDQSKTTRSLSSTTTSPHGPSHPSSRPSPRDRFSRQQRQRQQPWAILAASRNSAKASSKRHRHSTLVGSRCVPAYLGKGSPIPTLLYVLQTSACRRANRAKRREMMRKARGWHLWRNNRNRQRSERRRFAVSRYSRGLWIVGLRTLSCDSARRRRPLDYTRHPTILGFIGPSYNGIINTPSLHRPTRQIDLVACLSVSVRHWITSSISSPCWSSKRGRAWLRQRKRSLQDRPNLCRARSPGGSRSTTLSTFSPLFKQARCPTRPRLATRT